ncbi:ABC transporter ATP-binding protein [Hahella ganghwensis]|uniref:ABC transporter ATP-binding protein n=1 Tax=Hahella ganghwensis TaxID=286420 RepID=UPI00035FDF29|nr:ATP-binding cassette domain-containing protein [Hahella ganghwensis]
MSNGSLSIRQLEIGFLRDVTVTVPPGEIHCISGKSGSGKSRLLRAVADLEQHNGQISLGNTRQTDLSGPQWRKRVRLIPAQSEWWYDNVLEHFQVEPDPSLLSALELNSDILKQPVSYLSSGEKQRLALIRSLYPQPQALLLDEPTANLDEGSRKSVENWLLNMIRQQHWPVLWVAHDQEQINRVASHHWDLENGCLTLTG